MAERLSSRAAPLQGDGQGGPELPAVDQVLPALWMIRDDREVACIQRGESVLDTAAVDGQRFMLGVEPKRTHGCPGRLEPGGQVSAGHDAGWNTAFHREVGGL